MAVCGLRTLLLIVCILELIITVQRQVFDFLGYMWLPIIANFVNILLIIFGSFGAVQYITKYLLAYAIWSFMWLTWNVFLICYYLNLGSLNRVCEVCQYTLGQCGGLWPNPPDCDRRPALSSGPVMGCDDDELVCIESGLLSLGTGSVSWWEGNGWGCQPVWGEVDGPGTWRPARVDGCFFQWPHVELAQSALAALLTATALPLTILLAFRSFRKQKPTSDKSTLPRRQVYTIELSPTDTAVSESSLKPMTPRRVKRRSGSRGTSSSVRRSRRSYRNAGYLASNASLPRDSRPSRPTSAHSSYSNFHAARPASYHPPEREEAPRLEDGYDPQPQAESVPIMTNRYDTIRKSGASRATTSHDVVGPYNEPSRYDPPKNYETMQSYDNVGRGYEVAPYESRVDTLSQCESPSYGNSGYGYAEGWPAPPPAPPYSARATPQAPGPPAYQPTADTYNVVS